MTDCTEASKGRDRGVADMGKHRFQRRTAELLPDLRRFFGSSKLQFLDASGRRPDCSIIVARTDSIIQASGADGRSTRSSMYGSNDTNFTVGQRGASFGPITNSDASSASGSLLSRILERTSSAIPRERHDSRSGSVEKSGFIVVMGLTASGKTTFTNLASGANFAVAQNLRSCTQEIQSVSIELEGNRLTVIDTPGFDNTEISQDDLTTQITTFLEQIREQGKSLNGAIFFHRITDNCMGGVARKSLRIFRDMCEEFDIPNVMLVTNMWEIVDEDAGASRERELHSTFLDEIPADLAHICRHYNTQESALNILRELWIPPRLRSLKQSYTRLQTARDRSPIYPSQASFRSLMKLCSCCIHQFDPYHPLAWNCNLLPTEKWLENVSSQYDSWSSLDTVTLLVQWTSMNSTLERLQIDYPAEFTETQPILSSSIFAPTATSMLNVISAVQSSSAYLARLFSLEDVELASVVDCYDKGIESTADHQLQAEMFNTLKKLCITKKILPRSFYISSAMLHQAQEDSLGEDVFTQVWRAQYKSSNVVLKVLCSPVAGKQKAFYKEVLSWKYLSHPNVARFFGIKEDSLDLCMVWAMMEFGTINSYLENNQTVDQLQLILDISRGLQYLHSEAMEIIVHGNLKPSNILIDHEHRACLTDFGLSDILEANSMSFKSIRWAAPELLDPELFGLTNGSPTRASDVYALSMVIWEIFSGQVPYADKRHDGHIIRLIMNGARPTRPLHAATLGLSDRIWSLICKCWSPEYEKRPSVHSVVNVMENEIGVACFDKTSSLILVVGGTSCGKTTFVNLAAQSPFQVGHSLGSCTEEVQHWSFRLQGELVTLIDTPGFDDTERSQADIQRQITTFLSELYQSGRRLTGIIYMHRISDRRMSRASIENYQLFRKICGDMAVENVAIVTNMWEKVPPDTGAQREQELRQRYFEDSIRRGARMCRHDNTAISAQRILLEILRNRSRIPQFQDEIQQMAFNARLIMVMGSRGCGKTTFVNLAAGASFEVGHELGSCTQKVQSWTSPLGDETVTVIDTPGFDDTERPQADVLEHIAIFLKELYQSGKELAGVIYLHRISDIRMGGAARQSYRLFREICGDAGMVNVMLVTNMWDVVSSDKGAQRERELREHYFKDAIEHGARMVRHDNTLKSAQSILLEVLHKDPRILQIQDELAVQQMRIPETAVGVEFGLQLEEEVKKHQQQIDQLRGELTQVLSEANGETRRQDVEELRAQMRQLEEAIRNLQVKRHEFQARGSRSPGSAHH